MNNISGIIYKAENKINGHVYIGQTINNIEVRKANHKSDSLKKGITYPFYNAIRKHGFDNFEWTILCEANSLEKLNALEKFYISAYRKITICYNVVDGGGGMSGYKLSDETKLKISIANKGKCAGEKNPMYGISLIPWNKGKTGVYSEETLRKIGDSTLSRESGMKGKKFPEQSKIILSEKAKKRNAWKNENNPNYGGINTKGEKNGMYGRKHTEESKRKMSENRKGKKPWNKKLPIAPVQTNMPEDGDNDNE